MADEQSVDLSQLNQILHMMPDNNGVRLVNHGNDYAVEKVTVEHMKEHDRRKDKFNVVVMMLRPYAADFCNQLETEFYPPGTEKNNQFGCIYFKWNKLLFTIVSIPIEDRQHAEEVAEKVGARLANGVPTMIGSEDPKNTMAGIPVDTFPLRNEYTYNLEG